MNEKLKRAVQNIDQLTGYFQAVTEDSEISQKGVEMLLEIRNILEEVIDLLSY